MHVTLRKIKYGQVTFLFNSKIPKYVIFHYKIPVILAHFTDLVKTWALQNEFLLVN